MYTIMDYLRHYKDVTLKDVHWNSLDNLLCAFLVYLPIASYNGKKTFLEFYNLAQSSKPLTEMGEMATNAYEALEIIKTSKRYKSLKVCEFMNFKNEQTQFGACTFRIKNKTIVSFKGTDSSIIGWIENFRLTYSYPTYTHTLAINYLKTNAIKFYDRNIYIVGHSKGGNLAMVSAMESPKAINKKIRNVYNFDGPGFRKEQFESPKFKAISSKIVNIVPTGSVIGVLLHNENYNVVKSEAMAFSQHYPSTWNVFGEFFVLGEFSNISVQLNENTTVGMDSLDPVQMQDAFEKVFLSLEKSYSESFNFSFDEAIKFYKNMKSLDPEISRVLDKVLTSVLKIGSGR